MRCTPVVLLGTVLAVLPLSPLRAQDTTAAPAAPVDSVRLALARELLVVTQADQAFYRGVELALPGQRAANETTRERSPTRSPSWPASVIADADSSSRSRRPGSRCLDAPTAPTGFFVTMRCYSWCS